MIKFKNPQILISLRKKLSHSLLSIHLKSLCLEIFTKTQTPQPLQEDYSQNSHLQPSQLEVYLEISNQQIHYWMFKNQCKEFSLQSKTLHQLKVPLQVKILKVLRSIKLWLKKESKNTISKLRMTTKSKRILITRMIWKLFIAVLNENQLLTKHMKFLSDNNSCDKKLTKHCWMSYEVLIEKNKKRKRFKKFLRLKIR